MNIQQLEADLSARIMGLEDEESKLRRELECLRRLPLIAAEWEFDLDAAVQGREETIQEPPQSQIREDPFDLLRRKLAQNPDAKRQSGFSSRTLLARSA